MGSSDMNFLLSLKFKLVTQQVHFLFRFKWGKTAQNWVCVDANEIGPLFLKGVLNFIYGKTGTRNNCGLIRRKGNCSHGSCGRNARGGMDISYTAWKLLLMQYVALFYMLRPLTVCWTWDGSLSTYTSQSSLFAFVLAPKLIYTPTQTALYRRLTHSVYLAAAHKASTKQCHLLYDTLVWMSHTRYSHSWWLADDTPDDSASRQSSVVIK